MATRGQPGSALRLALGVAVAADVAEVGLELVDAADETAAVDLELGLAGTAGADAAALLAEVGAAAAQARQAVAELGQLDLRLALLAVGVLGEDVEDHRGAVEGACARGSSRG